VAETLLELTGADRSLLRRVDDRPGHDRRYSVDTSKLRAMGWSPQMGFDSGMRQTVDWYRENRSWWEPIKSGEYRSYYEQQYGTRLSSSAPA
jgi:dTDP-glucose 4,6-dehydratase